MQVKFRVKKAKTVEVSNQTPSFQWNNLSEYSDKRDSLKVWFKRRKHLHRPAVISELVPHICGALKQKVVYFSEQFNGRRHGVSAKCSYNYLSCFIIKADSNIKDHLSAMPLSENTARSPLPMSKTKYSEY